MVGSVGGTHVLDEHVVHEHICTCGEEGSLRWRRYLVALRCDHCVFDAGIGVTIGVEVRDERTTRQLVGDSLRYHQLCLSRDPSPLTVVPWLVAPRVITVCTLFRAGSERSAPPWNRTPRLRETEGSRGPPRPLREIDYIELRDPFGAQDPVHRFADLGTGLVDRACPVPAADYASYTRRALSVVHREHAVPLHYQMCCESVPVTLISGRSMKQQHRPRMLDRRRQSKSLAPSGVSAATSAAPRDIAVVTKCDATEPHCNCGNHEHCGGASTNPRRHRLVGSHNQFTNMIQSPTWRSDFSFTPDLGHLVANRPHMHEIRRETTGNRDEPPRAPGWVGHLELASDVPPSHIPRQPASAWCPDQRPARPHRVPGPRWPVNASDVRPDLPFI